MTEESRCNTVRFDANDLSKEPYSTNLKFFNKTDKYSAILTNNNTMIKFTNMKDKSSSLSFSYDNTFKSDFPLEQMTQYNCVGGGRKSKKQNKTRKTSRKQRKPARKQRKSLSKK
jgi:hypothetical protein